MRRMLSEFECKRMLSEFECKLDFASIDLAAIGQKRMPRTSSSRTHAAESQFR